MFLKAKHKFLLSLAAGLLRRPRLRIWWNYFKYRLLIGQSRRRGCGQVQYLPPEVFFWTTMRCNKRCNFCQFSGELNRPGEKDLSLEQFQAQLDHRLVRSALRICLYGGEPLLHPDLFTMIRLGKRRGHLMTVATNGLLLDACRDEILHDGPDLLSVSFYPEDRAVLEGPLKKVAAKVPACLHYVFSSTRLAGAWDAAEFALACNARWLALENVYPMAASNQQPVGADDPLLAETIRGITQRYGDKLYISWLTPRQRTGQPTICRVCWTRLVVDPRGRSSPCCVWPLSTYEGGLMRDRDIWNSAAMVSARQALMSNEPPQWCRQCDWLYDEPISI